MLKSSLTFRKFGVAAVLALGLIVFAYVALRAGRVALTIDEANTFNNYISQGFFGLFRVDTANNHVLNTFLTWLITRVAGTSVFVLRLPNLLSYLLYIVFSFRLINRYARGLAAICGFVALNANPYGLEFFSLCRGYGLSLGLLMAALFYFFRFMDEARTSSPHVSRSLSTALFAAGAAVLADLTLIFVFFSIIVLALIIFSITNARAVDRTNETAGPPLPTRRNPVIVIGLGAIIVLINGSNLFRNAFVSDRLFADVVVSISGLTDEECSSTDVLQKGIAGEPNKIPFATNGWRFDGPRDVTGIQVEIPAALWPKVTSLQVQVGPRSFVFSGARLRALASLPSQDPVVLTIPGNVSLPRSRFSPKKSSINWKGDGLYVVLLGERVLIFVSFLALLGLVLFGAGLFGTRLRLVTRSQYRLLAVGVWTVTALVAVPIFFLHKNGELYWGGKVGFFHDTWLGLIRDVFYGKSYVRGQEYIVLGLAVGVGILFLVSAMIDRSIRRSVSSGPAFALLALIFFIWGFYLGERPFIGLPYLLGRTAIFFLPLAGLAFIFALSSIQASPRFASAVAVVLIATALAAAVHWVRSMNTSFASEWMLDADNKAVLSDLESLRGKIGSSGQTLGLAVRWESYPALSYYVRQKRLDWLKLGVIPQSEGCDVYFLNQAFDESRMVLLKSYPRSGHILVAPK